MEQLAVVHFGPHTFTGQEGGYGDVPAECFDPADLDTDQWVRAEMSFDGQPAESPVFRIWAPAARRHRLQAPQ